MLLYYITDRVQFPGDEASRRRTLLEKIAEAARCGVDFIQLREKDLNQAAAYLLKEQDDFTLFATDVEGTFQKARQAADDFKAQVLEANLNHNSGSDVSAELTVMVAPDQIEKFLATIRGLGLRGPGSVVVVGNTPSFRGAIKKVMHLVTVEETDSHG